MNRATPLIAAVILLAATVPCRAELMISIGSLTIGAQGVGTVDVTLSSSNGTPINLDSFGFEFEITKVSGQGRLEFSSVQTDPFSNTNYVFYQNSGDNTPPGSTTLGTVLGINAPNDTYIGSDFTNDSTNASVTGSVLLAHLTFTAATSLPPTLGSTFQISLISDANTFFQYDSTTTPMLDAFEVSGGVIAVIPEPASFLLVVLGSLPVLPALGWKRRRRMRTS